jgi:hypothetical protein
MRSAIDKSDFISAGWAKAEAQSYLHHCGARVAKQGRLWTATSIAGMTFAGYSTAIEAMSCLKELDSSFWSYGNAAIMGAARSGVACTLGFLDQNREERREGALVCHLDGAKELPAFLKRVFKKHLFGRAHCIRCLGPMATLEMRVLREFDHSGSTESPYFVCNCGYPVWSVNVGTFFAFSGAIGPAETSWRREERISTAGGSHSPREIHEVLALQDNRCIYCNARFTEEVRPTKDHLFAVADGGTNWALNIVMACWRCNSRRSDIPFRTYCRLLGQKQNHRILTHLTKRLTALDILGIPAEAISSFDKGLAQHDSRHPRFLNIQNRSVIARRNAIRNQLLPCTRSLLLKKARANGKGAGGP